MAGLAIAALLGGGAAAIGASTAAVVTSGVAGAQMIGGTVKSFSEANKAKKRGAKAERALKKSLSEAKRRIDVNTAEQLSIPKEPYELMREANLVTGARALEMGQQGDTRGAAATAGRVLMAQQEQQADIRAQMGQDLFEIDKLVADEDKRRQQQLAGVAMAEAEGAQQAIRDAEQDKAAYLKQGFEGLTAIGEQALTSYAGGDYEQVDMRQGQRESVGVLAPDFETRRARRDARRAQQGQGDVDLSGFDFNRQFDITAPPAPDPYVTPGMSRRELNQVRRNEAQSRRRQDRLQRRAERIEPGLRSYVPGGAGTSGPLTDFGFSGEVGIGTNSMGSPFPESGGLDAPSAEMVRERAAFEQAQQQAAPQSVAGPRTPPFRETDLETRREMLERIERAAQGMDGGLSYGGAMSPEMMAFYGIDPPYREATGPRADTGGGGGGEDKKEGESGEYLSNEPGFPRTAEVSNTTELLEALTNNRIPVEMAQPATPEVVEEVNATVTSEAPKVGDSAAKVVEEAVENTDARNPVAVALQYLGIREPDYASRVDPMTQDTTYTLRRDSPLGTQLLTDTWSAVGFRSGSPEDRFSIEWNIATEMAWCGGFVDLILRDSSLTRLDTMQKSTGIRNKFYKTRADMYLSKEFGENIYTKEGIDGGQRADGSRITLKDDLRKDDIMPEMGVGSISQARMGDVVIVETRPKKNGRHVTFFVGYNEETGMVRCLGGNQGNKVSINDYPADDVFGIRRVNQPDLTAEELEKVSKYLTGGATKGGSTK